MADLTRARQSFFHPTYNPLAPQYQSIRCEAILKENMSSVPPGERSAENGPAAVVAPFPIWFAHPSHFGVLLSDPLYRIETSCIAEG